MSATLPHFLAFGHDILKCDKKWASGDISIACLLIIVSENLKWEIKITVIVMN